jgi:hypothetical protein
MAYVQDSGNVDKQFYGSVSGITEALISHDHVHDNANVSNSVVDPCRACRKHKSHDNVHDCVNVSKQLLWINVEHVGSTNRMAMCMTT